MVTTILLLAVLTACVCLYSIIKSKMKLFEKLKIPHEKPVVFLGNTAPFFFRRMSIVENIEKLYKRFSDARYFGFYYFTTPTFVIRDPDLITSIAIKNFDNFCDHRNFVNEELDPIASKNLFGMRGDHWREMRKLLSPAFTSSKMKMMFGLICQCADNFSTHMANNSLKAAKTVNVKEEMSKYATDVVASCAFGVSVDSFRYPKNEFYLLGREAMNFDGFLSLKFLLNTNFPKFAKMFRIRVFSKKVERFFKELVTSTVKIRDEKGITRPDMIQLMMENREKSTGPEFDIDEMTAQAFVFFLGGFDTVSTVMCFLAHVVAVNPDVQRKLRAEIDKVLKENDGKPTYEALNSMKYLDAVVTECMRLYPLAAFIDRLCVKNFELPPATPDCKPVTVKPGQTIWFPSYSLHRDPNYYPEPDKFDPDRFLNGHSDSSTYLPFGLGPRICLGNRFALMEMKLMLFYMLWRCDLMPDVKTKVPLVLNKTTLVMLAEGGFWLKLRARDSTAAQ
ncbi:PREDICTED: cytochrome P450 9e2 [Dinoponera quadriceps]|uniref:Cytochrome P450 9e2 n=1 Tax=Dinoponera quadriceps TaxID=609295 RepID=A0A6P3XF43_DINQU|nr:PREDICTED: cytochrome P450 9e2 [Dinoponera quadriceps]